MPGTHGFYQRGTHGFFVRGSHGFRGTAGECAIITSCIGGEWAGITIAGADWAGTHWSSANGAHSTSSYFCQTTWEFVSWELQPTPNKLLVNLNRWFTDGSPYTHPNIWVVSISLTTASGSRLYAVDPFESPVCNSPNGIVVDFSGASMSTTGTPPAAPDALGTIEVSL